MFELFGLTSQEAENERERWFCTVLVGSVEDLMSQFNRMLVGCCPVYRWPEMGETIADTRERLGRAE